MRYQFFVQLFDATGAELGREPIEPDWVQAREWVRFEAIRLQKSPATTAVPVDFAPLWDDRMHSPYVRGFRGSIGGEAFSVDFPKTYFYQDARKASVRYVNAGRLRDGEKFFFKLMAFAAEGELPGPHGTAEEIPQTVAIQDSPIARFHADSVAVGQSLEGDAPVFISSQALAQAKETCAAAVDVEVGGILLGRLHRDIIDRQLLFIEITAQVPAEHTIQEFTRLTFTPETWAAARAALRLRHRGEQMCGWFHLHPDFCKVKQCDAAKRANCDLGGIFFSSDDCALHRTVFPLPQHVALLISDRNGSFVPAVYGWRKGTIVQRGFHVMNGLPPCATDRKIAGEFAGVAGGIENGKR